MKHMSTAAIALFATLAAAGTAHADDAAIAGAVVLLEAAPVAMGIADIAGYEGGKAYGTAELVVGGATAVINLAGAAAFSKSGDEQSSGLTAMFGAAAAIDLAVAIHGVYLLGKEDRPAAPPLTIKAGSARGSLAPTVVSDGKNSAPGFGIGGTF